MSEIILMVTGHRPPKIGGYDNLVAQSRLLTHMEDEIKRISPDKAMSGFALGIDQIFAQAAINMGVPLIAAIPFTGQETPWPTASRDIYYKLLGKATTVHTIILEDELRKIGFAPALQKRNVWMADHSNHALAYWDQGKHGGTHNCLTYLWNKCIGDPDHPMRRITVHNPLNIIEMSEEEYLENQAEAREEQQFHTTGESNG